MYGNRVTRLNSQSVCAILRNKLGHIVNCTIVLIHLSFAGPRGILDLSCTGNGPISLVFINQKLYYAWNYSTSHNVRHTLRGSEMSLKRVSVPIWPDCLYLWTKRTKTRLHEKDVRLWSNENENVWGSSWLATDALVWPQTVDSRTISWTLHQLCLTKIVRRVDQRYFYMITHIIDLITFELMKVAPTLKL